MKVYKTLDSPILTKADKAIVCLGMFDGVHLGHQAVINEVVRQAKAVGGKSVVITFENHPVTVLKPDVKIDLLTSPEEKLKLLEWLHVDVVVMLPFTREFANQTAEEFLEKLMRALSFKRLVLGFDTTIGKDRQGNREKVESLAPQMGFEVEYFKQIDLDGRTISSSIIRKLLAEGQRAEAHKLLGH